MDNYKKSENKICEMEKTTITNDTDNKIISKLKDDEKLTSEDLAILDAVTFYLKDGILHPKQ